MAPCSVMLFSMRRLTLTRLRKALMERRKCAMSNYTLLVLKLLVGCGGMHVVDIVCPNLRLDPDWLGHPKKSSWQGWCTNSCYRIKSSIVGGTMHVTVLHELAKPCLVHTTVQLNVLASTQHMNTMHGTAYRTDSQ